MQAIAINLNEFFKSLPKWNIEHELGYKPMTTFWSDFSIADAMYRFGADPVKAIRATFAAAIDSWRGNYKYMTELSMVLNHKIFEHHAKAESAENAGKLNARDYHQRLEREYNGAWLAVDQWCRENLTGKELEYYYETTD